MAEEEDRDRITVYPGGWPETVTALLMSEARTVAGDETLTVSFEIPAGVEPMNVAALLVKVD